MLFFASVERKKREPPAVHGWGRYSRGVRNNPPQPDAPDRGVPDLQADAVLFLSWRVGLEALGIPSLPLIRAAKLPGDVGFRDGRHSHFALRSMVEELERVHGRRPWGLLVAEQCSALTQGALGFMIRHSSTIEDVFARAMRFSRLLQEARTTSITQTSSSVVVRTMPAFVGTEIPGHGAEYSIAAAVMALRGLMGDDHANPSRVSFRHPRPSADHDAFQRVLGNNVAFDEPWDEFAFPRAWYDRPVAGAVPSLIPSLEEHAQRTLNALPPVGQLASVVRAEVARALTDGMPSVEYLAKRLSLSPRTLQRRLADDGVSVSELIEQTRHQLALESLSNSSYTVAHVAFMTGFSDQSAFHRAFVRWEGVTPGEFRRRFLADDSPLGMSGRDRGQS